MSFLQIFGIFLKLGLTAFGGPIAHLGYFRQEFVERRRWLDDAAYTDLVALCQFLPGPASSQAGFAIGLMRGGWAGGAAAWLGFTAPSAAVLLAAAAASAAAPGWTPALAHGLKLAAVAVVAQAVWGMARALCVRAWQAGVALAALACTMLAGGTAGQILAIAVGLLAGALASRSLPPAAAGPVLQPLRLPLGRRAGALLIAAALGLLLALPALASLGMGWAMADAYYRAGALVFGGGHVVLPLLQQAVVAPGWVSQDAFLAGYGLAQAVPGPLFTVAAWMGAVQGPTPHGLAGGLLALAAIFLPGLLLAAGALPWWDALRVQPRAGAALAGAGAAVVGLLAGALYDPVWRSAVADGRDFVVAATAFVLLVRWRVAPWIVVLGAGLAGLALHA